MSSNNNNNSSSSTLDNQDASIREDNIREAKNQDQCKQVALDKFKDAFILYEKERYLGAFYMSGYVIENGIKSELCRLENKEQSLDDWTNFFNTYIVANYYSGTNVTPPAFDGFQPNIKSFLDFIFYILKLQPPTTSAKQFKNYMIETRKDIHSILEKRAPQTPENKYHDVKCFLEQLIIWQKYFVGENEINVDDYDISKFSWNSSLRYAFVTSIDDENIKCKAKQALQMALNFLKNVLVFEGDDDNYIKGVVIN